MLVVGVANKSNLQVLEPWEPVDGTPFQLVLPPFTPPSIWINQTETLKSKTILTYCYANPMTTVKYNSFVRKLPIIKKHNLVITMSTNLF